MNWKPIPDFPHYEVSSCGLVRSLDRIVAGSQGSERQIKGQRLKPWPDHHGYAMVTLWRSNKPQHIGVHRAVGLAFIGNYPRFDHKDQMITNNCASNLRPCTSSQNLANSKSRKGSSHFKGVSWDKARQRWRAGIMVNYKSMGLGRFDSEIDAAKAYNKAAVKHFGEFACVNEL